VAVRPGTAQNAAAIHSVIHSRDMDHPQRHGGRISMQYGLFTMPSHPPERSLYDGHRWDLQTLRWADELGFSEGWIGEHHTAPWEPHPSPDLLIAQALMETKNIRLAPGGFLLPYHHPAELANRVAMLDHMAQGRLNFGVAASGLPSDWAMFHVDGNSGQHREMTREALDIILKLWTSEEPFDYPGKYWQVSLIEPQLRSLRAHIKPFQKPHPPIGVAGISKGSETLKLAGQHGFLPMSLNLNPSYVATHWESVEEGARRSGRTPQRKDWRLVREIFVADTDEAAWRLSVGGQMGRMMREYFLPLLTDVGVIQFLKHDENVADSDVTPEYCAKHNWLIGSPTTVVEKIERMYAEVGGFGSLLLFCFDYSETPEAWRDSMRLLAEEVMPKLTHLTGS
jgi:alkanesulfonate monooxygenase SsuD/methylene tetrahydromethanopterin reductase-like flavin-dependent oxidoreductase (luciferase family)